jgi:hypothetical protein
MKISFAIRTRMWVYVLMLCLEVWREMRVDGKGGRRVYGTRGEENNYPFP